MLVTPDLYHFAGIPGRAACNRGIRRRTTLIPSNVSTAFYQLAAALSDCSGSLSDEIAAEAAELSHRLVTLSLIQVCRS